MPGLKIAIDAGHGPNTPGKRSPDGTLREFHFNSAAARYVAEMLSAYEGVETTFTFEETRDVPLSERTRKANAFGADIFISIHANAYGTGWNDAQGIETYTHTTRGAGSVKLAEAVQESLIRATGLRDRGVKTANFQVLRQTTSVPASILIEAGFMTNRAEAELLKSDAYRRTVARAIADAVADLYNLRLEQQVENAQVSDGATVYVGDRRIEGALIIEGRTYVPVRELADALGGTLTWDQQTRTARMTLPS